MPQKSPFMDVTVFFQNLLYFNQETRLIGETFLVRKDRNTDRQMESNLCSCAGRRLLLTNAKCKETNQPTGTRCYLTTSMERNTFS
jgi:hypothetical protein